MKGPAGSILQIRDGNSQKPKLHNNPGMHSQCKKADGLCDDAPLSTQPASTAVS